MSTSSEPVAAPKAKKDLRIAVNLVHNLTTVHVVRFVFEKWILFCGEKWLDGCVMPAVALVAPIASADVRSVRELVRAVRAQVPRAGCFRL